MSEATARNSFENACHALLADARKRKENVADVCAVLCEDGQTVMLYAGETCARCFGPVDGATFCAADVESTAERFIRRAHLLVVH